MPAIFRQVRHTPDFPESSTVKPPPDLKSDFDRVFGLKNYIA